MKNGYCIFIILGQIKYVFDGLRIKKIRVSALNVFTFMWHSKKPRYDLFIIHDIDYHKCAIFSREYFFIYLQPVMFD